MDTFSGKIVTNFTALESHEDIFINGKLEYRIPSTKAIQSYAHQQLQLLSSKYKRILNPAEYPVSLSSNTWDNKMKKIEETKNHIRKPVLL
ncbi:hypothetical protein [Oceanobacillus saliphilus]|uniref:hypothetical protein n=1 Tax=Oceanobacillus saliphilus TaxID=2925834 RepID=UPI0034D49AF7